MPVKIMYQNDILDEIEPACLDELISSNKIKKIFRSGGWASVATAPMRGRRRRYEGPERRRVTGKIMPPRYQYNLNRPASEQLRPDFAAKNEPSAILNKGSITETHGQMDSELFSCPECGGKCAEKEILDGSSVGITLLMKCTDNSCRQDFSVTYDGRGRLESYTLFSVKLRQAWAMSHDTPN